MRQLVNMSMTNKIRSILEAFCVGDAMGMPTEFMTQQDIIKIYSKIDSLLDPKLSYTHPSLPFASVTDDTEQVVYLLNQYLKDGEITAKNTANTLLRWVNETGAVSKNYIGPSSKKALEAIEAGASIKEAGRNGTTCGGIMRIISAVLFSLDEDAEAFDTALINCLLPTHNTSIAFEAAFGYAYAIRSCLKSDADPIKEALDGCLVGIKNSEYESASSSSRKRLEFLMAQKFDSKEELIRFLYDILGTGLASYEVFSAVFGIFLFYKDDVWSAIKAASCLGGDTDTIAALTGALCAAYNQGKHNIPSEVLETVKKQNNLNLEGLAEKLVNK